MRGHLFTCGTLVAALGLSIAAAFAENVDPGNSGAQYAWSENTGWVNAEPGGNGGNGMQVSDFGLTGWMWSENAGWVSLSCANTGSCGSSGYGVTNDGHGHLGGYAWGENVGWINFAPATGAVTVDRVTGEIAGMAWGENIGWINFDTITTDWCQSTQAVPTGGPTMRAKRSGSDVELSQLTLSGGAAWHEVVRGSLSSLRASGGDFAVATLDCAATAVTANTVVVSGTPALAPGNGYWYLARPMNCKGSGTFDSGAPRQVGSRDAEIMASGAGCP
jgi:hypothetical protein